MPTQSFLKSYSDSDSSALSAVIQSIGESDFGYSILRFAHSLCGASHSSVFRLRNDTAIGVASMSPASIDGSDTAQRIAGRYLESKAWLQDPALREARERLDDDQILLLRTDMMSNWNGLVSDAVYGHGIIADRLARAYPLKAYTH